MSNMVESRKKLDRSELQNENIYTSCRYIFRIALNQYNGTYVVALYCFLWFTDSLMNLLDRWPEGRRQKVGGVNNWYVRYQRRKHIICLTEIRLWFVYPERQSPPKIWIYFINSVDFFHDIYTKFKYVTFYGVECVWLARKILNI